MLIYASSALCNALFAIPLQRSPRCHFLGNALRIFPCYSSSEQIPSLPGNATPLLIVAYVSFSARMVSLQFHCASVQNTALSKPIYVFVAVAVPIWSFISLSNHSLSLPSLFPTWQFFSLSSLRNSTPVLCTSALLALGCSDSIQSFPSYSVSLVCLAFPCHRVSTHASPSHRIVSLLVSLPLHGHYSLHYSIAMRG